MVIEITDFSAPELDVYARLTEAQLLNRFEPAKGLFIAESPKVIHRALDGGCEPVSMLMERKDITGAARDILERCPEIPVYTADEELLCNLTGYHLTRGVLCAMRRPPESHGGGNLPGCPPDCGAGKHYEPDQCGGNFSICGGPGYGRHPADSGMQQPALRRSARVSMGTVFQIPWTFLPAWPEEGMQTLGQMGFKTAALALRDDSVSIDDPDLMAEEKLAVVLGSEGDGLTDSTIAACDYTVKIPMFHGVDSLNVAAASAVAFWQLRKG